MHFHKAIVHLPQTSVGLKAHEITTTQMGQILSTNNCFNTLVRARTVYRNLLEAKKDRSGVSNFWPKFLTEIYNPWCKRNNYPELAQVGASPYKWCWPTTVASDWGL